MANLTENPFEIEIVAKKILETESKISGIETDIVDVNDKLDLASGEDKVYLRKKEEQLRREKEQLRREKEQLRDQQFLLLKKNEQYLTPIGIFSSS